jgi:hypothetical protein
MVVMDIGHTVVRETLRQKKQLCEHARQHSPSRLQLSER